MVGTQCVGDPDAEGWQCGDSGGLLDWCPLTRASRQMEPDQIQFQRSWSLREAQIDTASDLENRPTVRRDLSSSARRAHFRRDRRAFRLGASPYLSDR